MTETETETVTPPQSYFLPRGQSVKDFHSNVRRDVGPTGKIVRGGTPGARLTSDQFNTTPLPVAFIEAARNKNESNGRTYLENLLATGVLVTQPGLEMAPTVSPAIGSELTVSPISGRITEDAK